MKQKVFAIFIFLSVGACSTIMDHFKIISAQKSAGSPIESDPKMMVKGESCKRSIFFIPYTTKHGGTLENAISIALEKVPHANALTDLRIKQEILTTVFYNYYCIQVEGKPSEIK